MCDEETRRMELEIEQALDAEQKKLVMQMKDCLNTIHHISMISIVPKEASQAAMSNNMYAIKDIMKMFRHFEAQWEDLETKGLPYATTQRS